MSRHPNTSGVFPINLVEFGINFKGFSYGTLHLQASKCSGGEKIFWDGASGLFSDFPISHRWHGYELLNKLSRLRRTHWDDMARHFLKQSAHWEGNILLFIEFWIQCYNRNRILSSILSKRKLLHMRNYLTADHNLLLRGKLGHQDGYFETDFTLYPATL